MHPVVARKTMRLQATKKGEGRDAVGMCTAVSEEVLR